MKIPPHTTSTASTTWLSLLILFVCCWIGFWPISFHIFSLKNDALNYFLPVRYQISEAIYNGHWPFWSPYFNLGYPLHGDMQSGVWNPVVMLFSLFGPYTLNTLQTETLLYVYLSGAGMFFLTKYFFQDWRVCLFTATAFMLCGFNSDSAQFLNWISAASFLPFAFLFYYRTLVETSWKPALCCGLFLYLLFTTAYPADFILTAYLFIAIFLGQLFKKENRTKPIIWSLLRLHFLIGTTFLLLSLPAIISYAEFLPLSERGSGASLEDALSNPLHPGLLFSFVAPLPIWKASFASITDPLERNCFFGFITFTFLILGLIIRPRHPFHRFIKWAFVVSLLFSFGKIGGLRVISYYLLPMMNTFRHPANAKLFTTFFACILAGFSYKEFKEHRITLYQRKAVCAFLLIFIAGLTAWALTGHFSRFSYKAGSIKSFLDSLSFSDLMLGNIILQVPFLILLYFAFLRKINPQFILLASLLNCTIHTTLFQPFTVVKKDRVGYVQNILDSTLRKGYPLPDLNASILENSKYGDQVFKEIGTANMYNKKIGRIDYRITPSNLLIQNEFWFNEKIKNTLIEYPFLYKIDSAIRISDTSFALEATSGKRFAIVANEETIKSINEKRETSFHTSSCKAFSPNHWAFEIESNLANYYAIFQNYYPRWELLIDGKRQTLQRVNISFMGFHLTPGKHLVSFQYRSTDLKIAFYISLATLLTALTLLIVSRIKSSYPS